MSILDVWEQIKKLSIGKIKGGFKVSYTTDINGTWNYTIPMDILNDSTQRWKNIIIHHSDSTDSYKLDTPSIRAYHMSFRWNYQPVSEQRFNELLISNPNDHFEKPDIDLAYHIMLEKVGEDYQIIKGRNLKLQGAHTIGRNQDSIGICMVGRFDVNPPTIGHWILLKKTCMDLMEYFNISVDNIFPHRFFNSNKTCPGRQISITQLQDDIRKTLG